MQVEIWSDVICPWCYIGKRRFEAALEQYPQRDGISVVLRSFELDPDAPQELPGTLQDLLSKKYGVSLEQAAAMNARVTGQAQEVGLEYDLSRARPGNTFDAHRLIHLAASRQRGDQAAERLMQGYFCEGLAVGDRAALAQLAPAFGVAEAEALALLQGNGYADAVRADETRAAQLGIGSVPFFVFDGKVGVAGAQPVATFLEALRHAGQGA